MTHLRFVPITERTYQGVLALSLAPEQEFFVATNTRSLADAYVFTWLRPVALDVDGTIVGFLMYGRNPLTGLYWLVRLMIGEPWQAKGFGRQAVSMLADHVAGEGATSLHLSLVPQNQVALGLYRSLGFVETGEIDEDGEIVMRLAF